MRRWSEVGERIAATTRTSEKTRLLADYLATLDRDALAPAVVFFSGRAFPEADGRALGLGWATLADSVMRVAGVSRAELGAAYDRHSDLGRAVGDVLAVRADDRAEARPSTPTAGRARVARPSRRSPRPSLPSRPPAAPPRRRAIFEALLRRCDPLTATYVVKILGGELRIGLREGLVEAAIARAFGRPAAAVARAVMLTGDSARPRSSPSTTGSADARLRLFHPLRFMLASPAEDAAEIVTRLGPEVWTEDKYDGIRAQLHRRGGRGAPLLARPARRDRAVPGGGGAARGLPWDGILDGELLAFRDGGVLPFLALQKRLGRKAPPPALLEEVPVAFVAFDLLAAGPARRRGRLPLLGRSPLRERRSPRSRHWTWSAPAREPRLPASPSAAWPRPCSADDLERIFAEARARRNEGLMVKDPASVYAPGRRGYGWLKMKKALATLDCVVVGVEVGHGKRHGVLSDYTFAVRDEAAAGWSRSARPTRG